MKRVCFVIQPFDGGKYDKRFRDTFEPAIREGGFDPYRVDLDPAASVPIDEIERRIREASACLADITEDNPNVWFELGLAIAFRKEICLVCSNDRKTKYPFDVQHRLIIPYSSESQSDFQILRDKIVDRLKTFARIEERIEVADSAVAPRKGLAEHEIACLGFVGSENDGLGTFRLRELMERAGYLPLAARMAIRKLSDLGLVKNGEAYDYHGDAYESVNLTESGWQWLEANISLYRLKRGSPDDPLGDSVPF